MCGRAYFTYTDEELAVRYLNGRPFRLPALKPHYNLAPTQDSPVVFVEQGEKTIQMMRFGLIPAWATSVEAAAKYSLINARSEEIDQKKSYLAAFKSRRCIVPLSGFFEWKKLNMKDKRPYAIFLKDHSIMSVAAIWEEWPDPLSAKVIRSFSIVTTKANSWMQPLHDRMPVVLNRKDEDLWLDPEIHDEKLLKPCLRSCPDSWLNGYEVTKSVNSPKNNSKELLVPLTNCPTH